MIERIFDLVRNTRPSMHSFTYILFWIHIFAGFTCHLIHVGTQENDKLVCCDGLSFLIYTTKSKRMDHNETSNHGISIELKTTIYSKWFFFLFGKREGKSKGEIVNMIGFQTSNIFIFGMHKQIAANEVDRMG